MSTTDTNKAPVDVIGWISEASTAIDRVYGPQAQLPKEADAVIAAVAELITERNELIARISKTQVLLDVAIANIQGGAA